MRKSQFLLRECLMYHVLCHVTHECVSTTWHLEWHKRSECERILDKTIFRGIVCRSMINYDKSFLCSKGEYRGIWNTIARVSYLRKRNKYVEISSTILNVWRVNLRITSVQLFHLLSSAKYLIRSWRFTPTMNHRIPLISSPRASL